MPTLPLLATDELALLRGLRRLLPMQQECVDLRFRSGLTLREMGTVLRMSHGAVAVLVMRSLVALRLSVGGVERPAASGGAGPGDRGSAPLGARLRPGPGAFGAAARGSDDEEDDRMPGAPVDRTRAHGQPRVTRDRRTRGVGPRPPLDGGAALGGPHAGAVGGGRSGGAPPVVRGLREDHGACRG